MNSNPTSRLAVISEILEQYKRKKRLIVVSQERQSNWAFNFLKNFRGKSSSTDDVLLNLTITKSEEKYHKILNIILALNVKAVVLLMEQDLAVDLMNAAEKNGFADVDCIWILEHSLVGIKDVPLLGKHLGIKSFRDQFDNKTYELQSALLNDAVTVLKKTFHNTTSTDVKILSSIKDCDSSYQWQIGKSLYR